MGARLGRRAEAGDLAEVHEINVTPFIDVMLVLLIIFMVAAPLATVEKIYADLGFEMTPAFRARLDAEQQRARKHETAHRYSLAEFGLAPDAIQRGLGDLYERFGWERAS